VHVYGYGFANAASVIRGTYGNYLEALKDTINGMGPISVDPIKIPLTLASAAEDAIYCRRYPRRRAFGIPSKASCTSAATSLQRPSALAPPSSAP
jgi:hypothetical protein